MGRGLKLHTIKSPPNQIHPLHLKKLQQFILFLPSHPSSLKRILVFYREVEPSFQDRYIRFLDVCIQKGLNLSVKTAVYLALIWQRPQAATRVARADNEASLLLLFKKKKREKKGTASVPSTGHESETAEPKADKYPSSTSHLSM